MNIYFAAPLHDASDQRNNVGIITALRSAGHKVYAPQEHGLWEDLVAQHKGDANAVRQHLYRMDLQAMQKADICVAFMNRSAGPSEGMMWEMGYMSACNKPVYILNVNQWAYNLMPEFGSSGVFSNISELIAFLHTERFV